MSRALGSNYTLEESIGRGAMGEVFRGTDRSGQALAFKVLHADLAHDQAVVERFVRERSILLALKNKNLVELKDLVIEGETLAIAMELVEGPDLRTLLNSAGTLVPSEVCRIGAGIAHGLTAVHAANILHRDIKPENVLIDRSTTPATPKVTDFGISSLIDTDRVRSTILVGTPQYIAPEISEGRPASPASDLYALGIVLYELACGVTPFMGGSVMAVLRRHSDMDPGRPHGIPESLWDLIMWLLKKNPAQRPTTAQNVATLLDALALELAHIPPAPRLTEPPAPLPAIDSTATITTPFGAVRPGMSQDGPIAAGSVPPPPTTAQHPEPTPEMHEQEAEAQRRPRRRTALVASLVALVLAGAAGAVWLNLPENTADAAPTESAAPVSETITREATPSASPTPSAEPSPSESASIAADSMPGVVGLTLTEAQTELGVRTKINTIDQLDESQPDGTVLAQQPLEGEELSDEVELTIARSAVISYLSDLEPVNGSWEEHAAVDISGATYAFGTGVEICRFGPDDPRTVEYNLGRNYRNLSAVAGLADDSENSSATVLVEVFADGRKVYSQTVSYGQPFDINTDMTDVLRMKIQWQPIDCEGGSAQLALGEARVEGVPGVVPSPRPTD